MIRLCFADLNAKKRALACLAGRFSFRSWATGEMIVPVQAHGVLALESISFQVEGPATYQQLIPAICERDPMQGR